MGCREEEGDEDEDEERDWGFVGSLSKVMDLKEEREEGRDESRDFEEEKGGERVSCGNLVMNDRIEEGIDMDDILGLRGKAREERKWT